MLLYPGGVIMEGKISKSFCNNLNKIDINSDGINNSFVVFNSIAKGIGKFKKLIMELNEKYKK